MAETSEENKAFQLSEKPPVQFGLDDPGLAPEEPKGQSKALDEAVAEAVAAGMSEEDARRFKEPEALKVAQEIVQRRLADARLAAEALASANTGQEADAAPQGQGLEVLDQIEKMSEDESTDPELLKQLKAMAKVVRSVAAKPAEKQADTSYDHHFARAGFEDVFGDGPTSELPPRSPERAQRMLVADEAKRIVERARAQKARIPSSSEAFQSAIASLHPQRVKAAEEAKRKAKIEDRAGQFIGRPTGSPSAELPKGRERAVENARQKLAQLSGA